jgi:hypothetical protein
MADFLESCTRLQSIPARVHFSGHGAPIFQPQVRLSDLIAHRESRITQIIAQLAHGSQSVVQIVDAIYDDLDPRLKGAAGRNMFAHLVDLYTKNIVTVDGSLGPDSVFALGT